MVSRRNKLSGAVLWPAVTGLLLIGIFAEASTRLKPDDAEPYMRRCRAAIESIPMQIGGWQGRDQAQPAAAIKLLNPNKIISREYERQDIASDKEQIFLLLVQCRDARDLQGHYPPNCYPAQGDREVSHEVRSWKIGDATIHGTEYNFQLPPSSGMVVSDTVIVYNFFITPHVPGRIVSHPELDGASCPDIGAIYKSGEDYQRRYYGAAEFQVVMPGHMSREQRDQVFEEIMGPLMPVIQVLMNHEPAKGADAKSVGARGVEVKDSGRTQP